MIDRRTASPAKALILSCSLLALVAAPARARAADDPKIDAIRESVVKITVSARTPEPVKPWTKSSPRDASGTGVVIEGKRILTNAHVVSYASQIFVESSESGEKIAATVEFIAPGIDLAIIKVDDDSFFDKRPALPRTKELPAIKDTVLTYGYPQGGSSLSVTKGIVSRIEFAPFGENTAGVRVQVDAAINPGNSGGPALIDGKVVGLIFSRLNAADNIGYIIPSEEIELFLADVKDGTYDGKPMMHDRLQTLENEALRAFLKVDKKTSGMVVESPDADDSPLQPWDLITKIGDREIDSTGMIKVNGDLRLRFQYLIQKLVKDGKVPLTVVRKGKTVKIELPVSSHRPMLVDSLKGRYPSYFLYGPLVFSPVTAEYLSGFDRAGNAFYAVMGVIGSPLVTRRGDRPKFDGEELVVVAAPIFPHKIGKGYDNPFTKVVKEVNGVKVKNLRHFVELLRDTTETFTTIKFSDRASETIVFNHKAALSATDDVLSDNGIRHRASEDLSALWDAKNRNVKKESEKGNDAKDKDDKVKSGGGL